MKDLIHLDNTCSCIELGGASSGFPSQFSSTPDLTSRRSSILMITEYLMCKYFGVIWEENGTQLQYKAVKFKFSSSRSTFPRNKTLDIIIS